MRNTTRFTATATLISGLLAGCAATGPVVTDPNSPTMKEIYEEHFLGSEADAAQLETKPLVADSSEVAQRRKQMVEERFSRVRNPMLLMYVYPHLSTKDNTPVPGYWTSFPLYTQVEYALPGEVGERLDE